MAAKEKHIEVTIKAPYYTINELNERTKKIWFVCHGYGQLSRYFSKKFEVLDDSNYLIFPQGIHKFYLPGHSRVGASWMTKEDRLTDIDNQFKYLQEVWEDATAGVDLADIEVYMMGFSQGVATIGRYLAHVKPKVQKLILWAGTFPPELQSKDFKLGPDTKVVALMGDKDEFFKLPDIQQKFDHMRSIFGEQLETTVYKGEHEVISDILMKL